LTLDCADTVYSMRIIFSAENGLPFAMKDPTGGSRLITQQMTRFDRESDPGKRVRSFLSFVYGVGSTASLPNDTYPVSPDARGIRPGGLLLTDAASHHSWTIQEITPEGLPRLVYSSRPAKTEILTRLGFPTVGFVFPNGIKEERNAGFRAFRHPEDLAKPVWEIPGYSRGQYEIPEDQWRETIQARLATRHESAESRVVRVLDEVCAGARERVTAVNEGLALLMSLPANACMTAQQFDDYSTPNRDRRLLGSFVDLEEATHAALASHTPLTTETLQKLVAVGVPGVDPASLPGAPQSFCALEISRGQTLTLAEVRSRSKNGLLSSNPHDPLEMRWGSVPGPSARARRCPVYE
jgi:hypothetical protein